MNKIVYEKDTTMIKVFDDLEIRDLIKPGTPNKSRSSTDIMGLL